MYVDNPHYATLKPNDIHHLSNLDKAIRHNDASMIDSTLQKLSAIKPELSAVLSNVVHLHKEDNQEAERLLSTIRKSNYLPVSRKSAATKNITPETVEQIINAVKAGQTVKGICKAFDITENTLLKLKVAHGIKYKPNHKKRKFTDDQLLKAMAEHGNDIKQVSNSLNVWPQAVAHRLYRIQ